MSVGINIEPKTPFDKSMLLLENDLDALGWDQPPRLYALVGEENDWALELVTPMQGHPVDFMRMMVATGRFADEVKGVAVTTEGWRHPHYEEVTKAKPEMRDSIMAKAKELGIPDDQAEEQIKKVFAEAMLSVRPSENPDRIEIRNVMVVMRDGRTMGVHRDRGSEAELMPQMGEGRVIDAMKATLTGEWPSGLESWAAEDARESTEAQVLQAAIDSVKDAIRKRKEQGND